MSEKEGTKPPSGMKPEGKRRPTVIKVEERKKPMTPTRMPQGITEPSTSVPKPEPRVMPGSTPQPTQRTQDVEPAKRISRPAVIAGVVRKGVEVSLDTLRAYFPGTKLETLEEVRALLAKVILDLLTDTQCVTWGENEQRRFGTLVDQSLAIIAGRPVKDGATHLNRLQDILMEISAALTGNRPQGLASLFHEEKNPKQVYEAHEQELVRLRQLLADLAPEIDRAETELLGVHDESLRLAAHLDAHALAARYLAEQVLDASKQRLANALEGRSASLLETGARIKQGEVVRSQAASTIQRLALRIRDGVHNALPGWIQTVTIVFQQSVQTKTDLTKVQSDLDIVLQKLK